MNSREKSNIAISYSSLYQTKLPNIIEFVLSSDTVDDRPVPCIFPFSRLLCFDHGTDLSQTASLLNTNLKQEEKGAESENPNMV